LFCQFYGEFGVFKLFQFFSANEMRLTSKLLS
jgi:hypothetical protein